KFTALPSGEARIRFPFVPSGRKRMPAPLILISPTEWMEVNSIPEGETVAISAKADSYRTIAIKQTGDADLFSRKGKSNQEAPCESAGKARCTKFLGVFLVKSCD